MSLNDNHLDNILEKVGSFGKYHLRVTILVLIAIALTPIPSVMWVFETKQINYRCEIPGCESISMEFTPIWWTNSIPSAENRPVKCRKYKQINNISHLCDPFDFNKDVQEVCAGFIYQTSELTILQDFNLHCQDNLWKLTLVGTINSIGLFIGLPITGILSDKYGRKTVLIGTMTLSALSGLVRSFTHTYLLFIIMEFTDSLFTAGSYAVCFTLGVELFTKKKRVLITSMIASSYSVGLAILGGIAWILQSWRPLLRIFYSLQLLVLLYYWLMPESVRWLLTKKKYSDVQDIIQKIAKTNGKMISEEISHSILYLSDKTEKTTTTNTLKDLFKSFTLTKRFINCCICWILIVFLYQGMSVYSLLLSDNGYLNFILTSLVEIPASIVTYMLIDRIGRRFSLSVSFLTCAISCVSSIFIPAYLYWFKLCTYLIGKFAATVASSVIFTFTTEIFPTPFRNSLLSTCSMFGRIGTLIAPQLPLLETIWEPLPLVLFGTSSLIGSVLSLLHPETMHTKLPDTITEAKNIGKNNTLLNECMQQICSNN